MRKLITNLVSCYCLFFVSLNLHALEKKDITTVNLALDNVSVVYTNYLKKQIDEGIYNYNQATSNSNVLRNYSTKFKSQRDRAVFVNAMNKIKNYSLPRFRWNKKRGAYVLKIDSNELVISYKDAFKNQVLLNGNIIQINESTSLADLQKRIHESIKLVENSFIDSVINIFIDEAKAFPMFLVYVILLALGITGISSWFKSKGEKIQMARDMMASLNERISAKLASCNSANNNYDAYSSTFDTLRKIASGESSSDKNDKVLYEILSEEMSDDAASNNCPEFMKEVHDGITGEELPLNKDNYDLARVTGTVNLNHQSQAVYSFCDKLGQLKTCLQTYEEVHRRMTQRNRNFHRDDATDLIENHSIYRDQLSR